MPRSRFPLEKVYPTYRPYPVTGPDRGPDYLSGPEALEDGIRNSDADGPRSDGFFEALEDPLPEVPFSPSSGGSPPAGEFRPLAQLGSLFADRLDFLHRALEELEGAREERQTLTQTALDDLAEQIEGARWMLHEVSPPGAVNDPEGHRRRHLERHLADLKRQRRQEQVLGWRDRIGLAEQIRRLQREIESLGKTVPPPKKRDASTPGDP